jgi:hypothetical protein
VLAEAHRILGSSAAGGQLSRPERSAGCRACGSGEPGPGRCSGCSRRSVAACPGGSPRTRTLTSHRACAARSSGPAGRRCWLSRRSWLMSGSPSRPPPSAAQEVPHRPERLATVRRRPHGGSTGRAAASVQLHRPPRRLTVIARLSLDCSRWMRPIAWSTSPASPGSRRSPLSFRAPLGAGGRARWWPWVHPDPTGLMSAWCPPTTPRDSADAVRAPWLCSIPTWTASSTTSPADFQPHTTLSTTTNPSTA